MKNRRLSVILAAVTALAFALTGCTQSTPPTNTDAEASVPDSSAAEITIGNQKYSGYFLAAENEKAANKALKLIKVQIYVKINPPITHITYFLYFCKAPKSNKE